MLLFRWSLRSCQYSNTTWPTYCSLSLKSRLLNKKMWVSTVIFVNSHFSIKINETTISFLSWLWNASKYWNSSLKLLENVGNKYFSCSSQFQQFWNCVREETMEYIYHCSVKCLLGSSVKFSSFFSVVFWSHFEKVPFYWSNKQGLLIKTRETVQNSHTCNAAVSILSVCIMEQLESLEIIMWIWGLFSHRSKY